MGHIKYGNKKVTHYSFDINLLSVIWILALALRSIFWHWP